MSDPSAVPVRAADLRFGVNVAWMGRGEAPPAEAARTAEAAGYDIVTAADHVGSASPFVALAAAAAVTERVRLRTYVLDHGFWNPGLLARDVATLDAISGGRVDLGLGAGHKPLEHEAVGLPFPPYAERLASLRRFVAAVREHLAGGTPDPAPVQPAVPVLVGAMSPRGLEVAALDADIVSLTGIVQAPGRPPGDLAVTTSALFDERVALVADLRRRHGRPAAPLDALLQQVVLGRDPGEVAAGLAADPRSANTAEELLDSPVLLLARTAEDAAEELVRRSARWGIGSWCVHQPSMAALAEVVRVLRS